MIDTTICPECGELAEVQDRDVLESTDAPVEHVKVRCVRRHWFLMPAELLTSPRADAGRSSGVSRSTAQHPPPRETGPLRI